jgi:hypothetical protein
MFSRVFFWHGVFGRFSAKNGRFSWFFGGGLVVKSWWKRGVLLVTKPG